MTIGDYAMNMSEATQGPKAELTTACRIKDLQIATAHRDHNKHLEFRAWDMHDLSTEPATLQASWSTGKKVRQVAICPLALYPDNSVPTVVAAVVRDDSEKSLYFTGFSPTTSGLIHFDEHSPDPPIHDITEVAVAAVGIAG